MRENRPSGSEGGARVHLLVPTSIERLFAVRASQAGRAQVNFAQEDSIPMTTVPVFALAPASNWGDLENAIAGSVAYQSAKLGRILPLILFAPMMEPANPDTWEPVKSVPENLLIVSVERSMDRRILKALQWARAGCGELQHDGACARVSIDFEGLVAAVYEQMTYADICSFARVFPGKDDPSFFFLRTEAAVRAFDAQFRKVKA